jgi:hypothetical protein
LDKGRDDNAVFGRADNKESLLKQKAAAGLAVFDLPEKLVTQSMVTKNEKKTKRGFKDAPEGLSAFAL